MRSCRAALSGGDKPDVVRVGEQRSGGPSAVGPWEVCARVHTGGRARDSARRPRHTLRVCAPPGRLETQSGPVVRSVHGALSASPVSFPLGSRRSHRSQQQQQQQPAPSSSTSVIASPRCAAHLNGRGRRDIQTTSRAAATPQTAARGVRTVRPVLRVCGRYDKRWLERHHAPRSSADSDNSTGAAGKVYYHASYLVLDEFVNTSAVHPTAAT